MGTTYSVILPRAGDADALALKKGVEAKLAQVNQQMSTYQADSELSQFNQSQSTDWFEVSADLVAVVTMAKTISEASEGAYDVTVGPLVRLWGFGPDKKPQRIPSDADIQSAQANMGYQKLETRDAPPALKKSEPGLYVDLSSIAKGYGVDQIGEFLESMGVKDYMAEIGGEIRARGQSHRGDNWRIGVEKPTAGERSVQMVVDLSDGHMATSGDYRNFFEEDGVRYSHTIDTRTGKPITHRLASVTVTAQSTAMADGWATALMVLGEEAGLSLANQMGLSAYFLYKSGDEFQGVASKMFQKNISSGSE